MFILAIFVPCQGVNVFVSANLLTALVSQRLMSNKA